MTSSLPPVSIGLPFYNAEKFLLDSIKSVFAQTHQDWELILMDDGSTDRSLEIAKSIRDPRVRVYSDGKNRKLASRLNEINDLAKFDFIARMDADDMMATDRIEKQLSRLLTCEDIDLVTTGVCSITDDAVPYGTRTPGMKHVLTPYKVLSGQHGIVHAAVVGRRDWFLRNRYDPSDTRAQDYKLWVRASLKSDLSVSFISEPLYYYREEGSATPQRMLVGQRIGREVIRRDGVKLVGSVAATYLLARSWAKSLITIGIGALGGDRYIARSRNRDTAPGNFDVVQENIQLIQRTQVAGLR